MYIYIIHIYIYMRAYNSEICAEIQESQTSRTILDSINPTASRPNRPEQQRVDDATRTVNTRSVRM